MKPRIEYRKFAPGAIEAMSRSLTTCGLESSLLELIKLRASQINGCAYCIDMHIKDARARGERERAVLAWTEAVTLIAEGHVPDEVYESVRQQFTEQELVNLTLAVVAINGWNRLAIRFRTVPEPTICQRDSRPGRTSSLPTLLLYMMAS